MWVLPLLLHSLYCENGGGAMEIILTKIIFLLILTLVGITIIAIALIIISVILTLIGGLIPDKKAAKKDPVIALRSE